MIWRMLDERYPERISFLDETDGYRFLITVMLSASTTDSQAEKAACRLFSVFPDAASVGNADEASIEALIRTAGLSRQKAGRIKAVSSYVAAYGIPSDAASLMALPGIGEKTAACYLVNILGEPAVIADTHFVRTARRLGFTDTSDRARAAAEIREGFPPDQWGRMSMVVNLHGRTVCRARPDCAACFLSAICPSSEAVHGGS